jgi:hypothetical protein
MIKVLHIDRENGATKELVVNVETNKCEVGVSTRKWSIAKSTKLEIVETLCAIEQPLVLKDYNL